MPPVVCALCWSLLCACSGPKAPSGSTPPAGAPPQVTGARPPARPQPAAASIHRVALSGEAEVAVGGTALRLRISESSAKIGAPVSRVNVLVNDGTRLAEAGWVIESGVFDKKWHPIEGRFWNPDAKEYQEGSVPGWEIRLLSLDDFHSNGSPAAVTVELRRIPQSRSSERTPPQGPLPEITPDPSGDLDMEGTPDAEGWYQSGTVRMRAPRPFSREQGELARRDLETFRGRRHDVATCYRRFTAKNPRLAGNLAIALTLTQDGRVTACRLEKQLSEHGVGACVCGQARAWRFPAGIEPGPRIVRYSWSLVPE